MVTAAEATTILEAQKVIGANLVWKGQSGTFRLEATVLAMETNELLSLRGFVGVKNRSYALLYKNTPIRKYTVHARHRNPDTGLEVSGPHKHSWDDVWEDQLAYIPSDIQPGDPNTEQMEFLAECNIELRGSYAAQTFFFAVQGGSP